MFKLVSKFKPTGDPLRLSAVGETLMEKTKNSPKKLDFERIAEIRNLIKKLKFK